MSRQHIYSRPTDAQPKAAAGPVVEHTYARPTDAQVKFATGLAVKAGYPRSYALAAARKDRNGKNSVGDMSRQECSEIIEWLKAKVG